MAAAIRKAAAKAGGHATLFRATTLKASSRRLPAAVRHRWREFIAI
jgi:hypothetical protein